MLLSLSDPGIVKPGERIAAILEESMEKNTLCESEILEGVAVTGSLQQSFPSQNMKIITS